MKSVADRGDGERVAGMTKARNVDLARLPGVLCVVTVPFDPHRLSLNQRLHWRSRKSRNDVAKRAARYAYLDAGAPSFEEPVRVEIIVRRGREIDADNALSGCKPLIDALFCRRKNGEGIIPDDSPRWLELTIPKQEPGARWKGREEVVFLVRRRGSNG